MSLRNAVSQFSHLRVYKMLSTPSIMNLLICNRIMKMKPVVAHAPRIYQLSQSVLGSTVVDTVIRKTFCKALTAGNTL